MKVIENKDDRVTARHDLNRLDGRVDAGDGAVAIDPGGERGREGWPQHLLLHGDLAKAEPKTLRYRLLQSLPGSPAASAGSGCVPSAPDRGARDLAAAFAQLTALPVPTG